MRLWFTLHSIQRCTFCDAKLTLFQDQYSEYYPTYETNKPYPVQPGYNTMTTKTNGNLVPNNSAMGVGVVGGGTPQHSAAVSVSPPNHHSHPAAVQQMAATPYTSQQPQAITSMSDTHRNDVMVANGVGPSTLHVGSSPLVVGTNNYYQQNAALSYPNTMDNRQTNLYQ